MPLSPNALASSLEASWLVPDGGEHPASATASGDAFASAVTTWFAAATAGVFPCSTAGARRPQLAATAGAAFQANDVNLAATQLALALMGYMSAQVFGAGVASPPTAVSAAQTAFAGVFSDLEATRSARASRIATGTHTLALSTIVVFPPVISPPLPVT